MKKEAALFVQRQAVESIRETSVSLHPLISNAGVFFCKMVQIFMTASVNTERRFAFSW